MKRVARELKKYFIPHEENEYKPHLLRMRTVVFFLAIMFFAEVAFLAGPFYFSSRSQLFGVILTNALVDGTNQNRAANNVSTLTVSPLLQAAAQMKADDMAKNGYFAHTSPAGITPWYWFQQVGYDYEYAGENLAVNFSDSQDVTNAWMNSPEHRANILNSNFTQIGIATATGTYQGQEAIYVVELFGTPSSAQVAFVDTAAAAAIPVATPKPVSRTVVKPISKPVVSASKIVTTTLLQTTTSQQMFIAVKGAEAGTSQATETAPQVMPGVTVSVPSPNDKPSDNIVQNVASSPRQVANYFYLFLMVMFLAALALNVFIKIRIQHPQLIFNGVLVIALAALFVVLNQQAFLAHASIF